MSLRMNELLASCTTDHLTKMSFLQRYDPGCIFLTVMASSCCECHSFCHNSCGNNLLLNAGIQLSEIYSQNGTAFYYVDIPVNNKTHINIVKRLLKGGIKINTFPAMGQNALMAFFPHYGKGYWGPTTKFLYAAGALIETNRSFIDCQRAPVSLSWGPNNLTLFAVGVELDYYSVMCNNDQDSFRKHIHIAKLTDSELTSDNYPMLCDKDANEDIDNSVCYCSILQLYPDLDSDPQLDCLEFDSEADSETDRELDTDADSTHLTCSFCANGVPVESTCNEVLKCTDTKMLISADLMLEQPFLKHLSRMAIRNNIVKLRPHQNLFETIPKLGLPSLLTKYLLFNISDVYDSDENSCNSSLSSDVEHIGSRSRKHILEI